MIYVAILLLVLAMVLFWQSARQQKRAGLPAGRVIYVDTTQWGNKTEKPLYDPVNNLTGKPDYLVEEKGRLIPVEVKSGWAPDAPRDSHIFQLAAYLLLVERTSARRPPYGIIHYRNRDFAIDYTPALEAELMDLLVEMRRQDRLGLAERSHDEPQRCAHCGYRSICDEKIS